MRSECSASRTVATALFFLAGAISMFAQNGKLNLHVIAKQAYIFVDDRVASANSGGGTTFISSQPAAMRLHNRTANGQSHPAALWLVKNAEKI
jgi:hypothetical protein